MRQETSAPATFNQDVELCAAEQPRTERMQHQGPAWTVTAACAARTDPVRLCEALQQLAVRHQVLRTTFCRTDLGSAGLRCRVLERNRQRGFVLPGLYEQRVQPYGAVPCIVETTAEPRHWMLSSSVEERDAIPIHLYATLHQAGQRSWLRLTVSRLIADRQSLDLLLTDLDALYTAGTAVPLSQPDAFARHAAGEKEQWASAVRDPSLDYWRSVWRARESWIVREDDLGLAGAASPAPSTDVVRVVLDAAVAGRIEQAVAAGACSRQSFAGAVAAVALHALTFRPVLGLWVRFANRHAAGTRQTVGWFSNLHPVVIDLCGDPVGAELIDRVSSALQDADAHSSMPLPALWCQIGARMAEGFRLGVSSGGPAGAGASLFQETRIVTSLTDVDAEMNLQWGSPPELTLTYRSDRMSPERARAFVGSLCGAAAWVADGFDNRLSTYAAVDVEFAGR